MLLRKKKTAEFFITEKRKAVRNGNPQWVDLWLKAMVEFAEIVVDWSGAVVVIVNSNSYCLMHFLTMLALYSFLF